MKRSAEQSRRGGAMIEMVLTLPILFVLLLMLAYYGWSMARLQRVSVQDRYEVWRGVHAAPGPRFEGDEMNNAFWGGEAADAGIIGGPGFPSDTRDAVLEAVPRFGSNDTTDLAEHLQHRLPYGASARASVSHSISSPMLQQIDGTIVHAHRRLGNEWKYANSVRLREDGVWIEGAPRVTPGDAVAENYVGDELDGSMESIGNNVSNAVRGLYRWFPGYYGPDVDYYFRDYRRN